MGHGDIPPPSVYMLLCTNAGTREQKGEGNLNNGVNCEYRLRLRCLQYLRTKGNFLLELLCYILYIRSLDKVDSARYLLMMFVDQSGSSEGSFSYVWVIIKF